MEMVRLPERRIITLQASVKVPPKIPRWYRAAVQLLTEATGRWPNREIAHKEIMIAAGFFETITIGADGKTKLMPQSTAEWGLVEWRNFLDAAMPVLVNLAGETPAKYRDRVDGFLGLKLKEALEDG